MAVTFYPHADDAELGSISDRLELLMEAAERYKAAILENSQVTPGFDPTAAKARLTPREMKVAFNWQEIAKLMREIRESSEQNQPNKLKKDDHLTRLAEVYEILRAAKMPKLEAVRIALMNEAKQLRGGAG
jgi:hypothetical protein